MDESISKTLRKQEEGEIPIVTFRRDDACWKAVEAETHSSRDQTSKRCPDAQDQNSKSNRPCEAKGKKPPAANGTAMEGDREGRTISARLRNQELWEMFNSEGTEMIITKAGRLVMLSIFLCLSFRGRNLMAIITFKLNSLFVSILLKYDRPAWAR